MLKRGMRTLVVRVLPAHRAALARLARSDGEPMGAVVRRLIRAEAQRRGLWPVKEEQPREVQPCQ